MKKFLTFVLAICLILPCAMFFVGCGGPEGTYKLSEVVITQGDKTYTITQETFTSYESDTLEDAELETLLSQGLDQMFEMMTKTEYELKSDNTIVCTLFGETEAENETAEGTWSLEGDQLSITIEESSTPQVCTYSNGSFYIEDDMMGMTIKVVFKK